MSVTEVTRGATFPPVRIVSRDWTGEPCEPYTVPIAPRPESAAFRASDRRADYSTDKARGFAAALQTERMFDWAFAQSGALVTRDGVLAGFAR